MGGVFIVGWVGVVKVEFCGRRVVVVVFVILVVKMK